MQRIFISDTPKYIGQNVKLAGWVNIRRDHGRLIFIDLRDRSGIIQTVIIPDHEQAYKKMEKVITKHAVELVGLVKESPACTRDDNDPLKCIEIEARRIKILNESIRENNVKNIL